MIYFIFTLLREVYSLALSEYLAITRKTLAEHNTCVYTLTHDRTYKYWTYRDLQKMSLAT